MEQLFVFDEIIKLINQNFPFENKKEIIEFSNVQQKYHDLIDTTIHDREFFEVIRTLLKALNNSHTKLCGFPEVVRFYSPRDYKVLKQDHRFYLFKKQKILGEILEIDSKQPYEILDYWLNRVSGSTPWLTESRALRFLLFSEYSEAARIKLLSNKIKNIKLDRIPHMNQTNDLTSSKIFQDKIGYLHISTWTDEKIIHDIEKTLNNFSGKNIRGLIIDVRGNQGGNSNYADALSGHFFQKPYSVGSFKQRENSREHALEKGTMIRMPKTPYYNWPVILLSDRDCFSSNEIFIASMKDNGRATVVGETTGGGSGNPKSFTLSLGKLCFSINISTWIYHRPNGELVEGRGITPDFEVHNDLFSNEDKILAKALDLLRGNKE